MNNHRASLLASGLAAVFVLGMSFVPSGFAAETARSPDGADAHITAALKDISGTQIKSNIAALVGFGTRSTLSAQDPEAIAAGRGIAAAREWIKTRFEQYSRECGDCLEVKIDSYTQQPAERIAQATVISNVYAVLKGTDPVAAQHIVLVTGHYDSRNSDNFDVELDAPGANDDASGVAVSLECARVLSKLKFPATIIFLTVAGEEQGLYGSRHFAQMARDQNWQIDAVLNNDIVGGNREPRQDAKTVRLFSESVPDTLDKDQLHMMHVSGGESDSASRELARFILEAAATYHTAVKPLLIFRADRFLRGGDHTGFNEQGYAAVRFTEFREDFNRQHQNVRNEGGVEYGDLAKFVNTDYIAHVAQLNAATLAALASAPPAPTHAVILASKLENESTLEWDTSPAANYYEVLWRATSSAHWEHVKNIGNVNHATLDLSKDNVIFAVRAVDARGHRSLSVVPEPKR